MNTVISSQLIDVCPGVYALIISLKYSSGILNWKEICLKVIFHCLVMQTFSPNTFVIEHVCFWPCLFSCRTCIIKLSICEDSIRSMISFFRSLDFPIGWDWILNQVVFRPWFWTGLCHHRWLVTVCVDTNVRLFLPFLGLFIGICLKTVLRWIVFSLCLHFADLNLVSGFALHLDICSVCFHSAEIVFLT